MARACRCIAGFGAVAVFVTIGTAIGLIAGAFGGVADQVLMRFTDIMLSHPAAAPDHRVHLDRGARAWAR